MKTIIKKDIEIYLSEKKAICDNFPVDNLVILVKKVIDTYLNDGTVYVMANGGASSAAEGFATDLRTHPFVNEDKSITTEIRRLKVACLTESSGMITGISNDIGFDKYFF